MKDVLSISFEEAEMYCRKALELASQKTKVPIAVTVINATGMVLCTMAMDNTLPISPTLSVRKAITALHLKIATIELQKQKVNVADLGNNYCCFGGGVPITDNNKIVGAIGVSGFDTDEADHDIADAAYSECNRVSSIKMTKVEEMTSTKQIKGIIKWAACTLKKGINNSKEFEYLFKPESGLLPKIYEFSGISLYWDDIKHHFVLRLDKFESDHINELLPFEELTEEFSIEVYLLEHIEYGIYKSKGAVAMISEGRELRLEGRKIHDIEQLYYQIILRQISPVRKI